MYKKTKLRNGIRIIRVQNRNIETTTVMALFGVGSRDENGRMEGMAHFLEHMFFKGTEKRLKASDINKEYTGFWAQTEKKDLDLALDVLSDILLRSKFDPKEIENEKGAIIEEINMYEDAPMRDIPSVFESMIYKGQTLGHDQLGSKENVKSFTRKDVVGFYKKHYVADNLILAVSGNFDEKIIRKRIEKYFAHFPVSKSRNRQVKNHDSQTGPEVFIKQKKTDQTNFSLGFRAYPTDHKD
jgi:predicted Zn-dependent peptidase